METEWILTYLQHLKNWFHIVYFQEKLDRMFGERATVAAATTRVRMIDYILNIRGSLGASKRRLQKALLATAGQYREGKSFPLKLKRLRMDKSFQL